MIEKIIKYEKQHIKVYSYSCITIGKSWYKINIDYFFQTLLDIVETKFVLKRQQKKIKKIYNSEIFYRLWRMVVCIRPENSDSWMLVHHNFCYRIALYVNVFWGNRDSRGTPDPYTPALRPCVYIPSFKTQSPYPNVAAIFKV